MPRRCLGDALLGASFCPVFLRYFLRCKPRYEVHEFSDNMNEHELKKKWKMSRSLFFQSMFCSFSLLLPIRLTVVHSTTGAFGSLRSSDAEKKRRPRLGIFCLIRQKPPCQLRVATAPVLRSCPRLF